MLIPGLAWGQSISGQDIVLHGNNNGAPALAGLPAGVIVQALTQMAQGQGGNAIMQSIARSLTPEERSAAARYFAALKSR